MLKQEREALFEKMISGPGITATKFPRRGKPRTVVLTLALPGVDSANLLSSSSRPASKSGKMSTSSSPDGK